MSHALVVLAAVTAISGPAPADPAGDWRGVLHTPGRTVELGLEVRRDARGGYGAAYDDITHGYWDLPMRPIGAGAPPGFELRSPYGVMTYGWNPARGRWGALWREKSGDYRFTLERGTIPPKTRVSTRDKIVLGVFAAVILLEAGAIAWLLRQRRRRRLRVRAA